MAAELKRKITFGRKGKQLLCKAKDQDGIFQQTIKNYTKISMRMWVYNAKPREVISLTISYPEIFHFLYKQSQIQVSKTLKLELIFSRQSPDETQLHYDIFLPKNTCELPILFCVSTLPACHLLTIILTLLLNQKCY